MKQTSQSDDFKLKQDVNKTADIENIDSYGIVTASVLNVRYKASLDGNIIGTLKKGDKVKLAIKVGDWLNIYYGEHGGFVSSKYIKLT
ncbi:SH3 domain-containing protein [Sarcina ventriculi]|uniref:SH3 domain-containing protein n=1 Tax=Sarcina ventriculi TaxID=1267 RepID=UPI0018A8EFC7